VFVLDSSASEGTLNFHKQLDFVSRVVNDFQIGPQNVQIGVLTFADQPALQFNLNQYTDKQAVLNAIQRIPYASGVTYTDKALTYVNQNMFTASNGARNDAKHYVIVLTDGASTDSAATIKAATTLKQNVDVIAIGIGSNTNQNELNTIASDAQHVFTVTDFDALRTLRTDIKAAACEGTATFNTQNHSRKKHYLVYIVFTGSKTNKHDIMTSTNVVYNSNST